MAPPDPHPAPGLAEAQRASDSASPLAVVIVNWNRTRATIECLESLATWQRVQPQIWVVDNGSDDGGLEEIGRRFPSVRLLRAGANLGFGGGNNRALRQIRSPYALLLNNDAHIDEASVERLLQTLEDDATITVAGPVVESAGEPRRVLSAGGRDILRHVRTHLTAADVEPGLLHGSEPFEVDYVPGSAALLRMPVLRELGYLDEQYFFGGELADLCHRARAAGGRSVVLPAARATHNLEVASNERRQLYPYYILRNRFLFLRKLAGVRGLFYLTLWIGLGLALASRAGLRWRWAEARALGLGLIDGLGRRSGSGNHHFKQRATRGTRGS